MCICIAHVRALSCVASYLFVCDETKSKNKKNIEVCSNRCSNDIFNSNSSDNDNLNNNSDFSRKQERGWLIPVVDCRSGVVICAALVVVVVMVVCASAPRHCQSLAAVFFACLQDIICCCSLDCKARNILS
jgi:hypothetical protein